jgi:hypothetical protein
MTPLLAALVVLYAVASLMQVGATLHVQGGGLVVPLALTPWLLVRGVAVTVLLARFGSTRSGLAVAVGSASGQLAGTVLFEPLAYGLLGALHRYPVGSAMVATMAVIAFALVQWARHGDPETGVTFSQRAVVTSFVVGGAAAAAATVSLTFRVFAFMLLGGPVDG